MSTVKKFEDLEVWKMARELCQEVFKMTLQEAFSRDFGLKNQIQTSQTKEAIRPIETIETKKAEET